MYETQIRNGIRVLDAYYATRGQPDWKSMINLKMFDIRQCKLCVLGQLFGDFYDGLDEVGISKWRTTKYELGFSLPDLNAHTYEEEKKLWDILQREWTEELAK